jgi:hypothetical protein
MTESRRGGGPGWTRTIDQPIMRPDLGRLRECQGVSGVLNKHERRVVFVSQSVLECHGADVKTVVRPGRLTGRCHPSDGGTVGGKISQEFTWRLTRRQEVSGRLRASQRVSPGESRPCLEALPASRTSDTVRRVVHLLRDVQEIAADAGESQVSARTAAAGRGTRNTVPSRAFAAGSIVTRCGHAPQSEGRR